jgi:Tol biopolymer transport system component
VTAKRSLARAAVLAAVLATAGRAQTTEVVSVSAGGGVPNGVTPFDYVSLSSDGRYVAFSSDATDLVPGGTSGRQIFVRDRVTHTTELVSVSTSGGSGNGVSRGPRISEDGRFVAFNSHADDLVAFDGNVFSDVFVRDRQSGTTVRVNVDAGGTPADAGQDLHFYAHSISASGRYVGFASPATNLVPGDTNGVADAFVKDLLTGSIERASLGPGNAEGDAASNGKTSVSADGRYASFSSNATNLVGTDVNGFEDVFVRDLAAGTTELASVSTGGTQANGTSLPCTISADGRYVVFHSNASNLVAGDTNGKYDVFLRDRQNGTTERVSVDSCGGQSDNHSLAHEAISADGRYVAFSSSAANLVPDDLNASRDVFLKDRTTGDRDARELELRRARGELRRRGDDAAGDLRRRAARGVRQRFGLRPRVQREHGVRAEPRGHVELHALLPPGRGRDPALPLQQPADGAGTGLQQLRHGAAGELASERDGRRGAVERHDRADGGRGERLLAERVLAGEEPDDRHGDRARSRRALRELDAAAAVHGRREQRDDRTTRPERPERARPDGERRLADRVRRDAALLQHLQGSGRGGAVRELVEHGEPDERRIDHVGSVTGPTGRSSA